MPGYVANFTDDAVLELPHGRLEGRAELQRMPAPPEGRSAQHLFGQIVIDLDGNRATTRAYLGATHIFSPTDTTDNAHAGGWYQHHVVVRTPDGWRICELRLTVTWEGDRPMIPAGAWPAAADMYVSVTRSGRGSDRPAARHRQPPRARRAAGRCERGGRRAHAFARPASAMVDGDHAWLDTAALRARGSGTPEWLAGYDEMLAYAARSGWTSSADGTHVRAHLVRSPAAVLDPARCSARDVPVRQRDRRGHRDRPGDRCPCRDDLPVVLVAVRSTRR